MEEIDIPNNVLIRCPKTQFNLVRVSGCASCDSFKGVVDRFPGSQKTFTLRYMVQCSAEPIKRELFELVESK